jgi:TPR repeat protein
MDENDELERSLARRGFYAQLNPVAIVGLIAGAVPFGLHFTVNGLDYVKLGGGSIALVAAGIALIVALARASSSKGMQVGMALAAGAVGAFHVVTSGFALGGFLGSGEDRARAELEERGFTDLVLTPSGEAFAFEGRRNGERCDGTVAARGNSVFVEHRCGLPEPLERVIEECDRRSQGPQCAEVALRLREVERPDWVRMTRYASRACELGEERECFYVGVAHELGDRGLAQSDAEALRFYQRACAADVPGGCGNEGVFRANGRGLAEPDHVGANRSFRRACDLGLARSCDALGISYREALGVEVDHAQAFELFRRACEGDFASGCVNQGAAYLHGEGVEQDRARARALYARACGLDPPQPVGCRMDARLELEGVGEGASPTRGAERLEALCATDARACLELGVALHQGEHLPEDRVRAFGLLRRACDQGSATGCRNVGLYHLDGFGGAARDETLAQQLFERACQGGDQPACQRLGR